MAINKVIYDEQVLIDLTGDTVIADKLLKGYTAHGKDGEPVVGTCEFDADTQDATAAVGEILKGKTAYARGTKLDGTMPNNGAVSGEIATKDGNYTVPMGFHDGNGSVGIADSEKTKLVSSNIKSGVQLLGVTGTYTGDGAPIAIYGAFEKFDDWTGIVAVVDMSALIGTFELEDET